MLKKYFSQIILALSACQIAFDTLNQLNVDAEKRAYIGGFLMLAIIILTGIKQYFDPETSNKSLWFQILLFTAYMCGALMDNMSLFTKWGMSETIISNSRLCLTLVSVVVTQLSKQLFPQTQPDAR